MMMMSEIKVSGVRWIKLGNKADDWEDACITKGLLPLGYDLEVVDNHQTKAFIGLDTNDPENIVWITRHQGYLYWGQAPTIYKNETFGKKQIQCRTIKWQNHPADKPAELFVWERISGEVTKTASYRQTICKVKTTTDDEQPIIDYITDMINGSYNEPPADKEFPWGSVECLNRVKSLAPTDFELFVANTYSLLGYVHYGEVGGSTQKHTDLVMLNPENHQRVVVQIKTKATQKDVDNFINFAKALPENDEALLVYHSVSITPAESTDKVRVIQIEALMKQIDTVAHQKLLMKWLQEKCKFGFVK